MESCKNEIELEIAVFTSFTVGCDLPENHSGPHSHKPKAYENEDLTITWKNGG